MTTLAAALRPPPRVAAVFAQTRFRLIDAVVLAAAALLVVQAPRSVVAAAWVPSLETIPTLALFGLVVGYLIERTRLPGVIGIPLGLLFGFEAVTYAFARVGPGSTLEEQVAWLGERAGSWYEVIVGGGVSNDPLVFALAMGALAWLLGLGTAWLVFRDHAPWLAIVLNGLALLMNLWYASTALVGYVGWFAFAACLLLAAQQLADRTELWRRAQLGVQPRVVVNVLIGTAVATGAFLWLAWALPDNVTSPAVASGFTRATQPWTGLEGEFDRWFAALNGSDRNARGLSFGRTLAPRGAFDLGDTPVLEVRAAGPLYLRATTADRYASQAITSSETTTAAFEPSVDLLPADQLPLARGLVQAQIRVLASRTSVAFAPDQPVRFSQGVEVDTRGTPDDIATVRLDTPVQQNQDYSVVSAVSTATNQELRAAGENYSDEIRRRYLQLPRGMPRRVIDLAHDATGGATSAFDRAIAIEGYLRDNYTYTTHVATLPTDQDWIDYFLFDSREGYCDYFATAMVVMLRVEGIPARVASGFAPGEIDPTTNVSLVRENHAHSWVEIYFPRYGWVTFEPSSIRPLPTRFEDAGAPVPLPPPPGDFSGDYDAMTLEELNELLAIQDMPTAAPARPFYSTLPGIALATLGTILLIGLIVAGIVLLIWRRGLRGLAQHQQPYAELVRLGRWSGTLRPRRSDTPFEIAARLARQVPRAQGAIDELTTVYVEGTYAPRAPRQNPWPTWLAVRRDVIRGLFGRRLGGWFGEDASVAPAPKGHPELLSRWGAGRRRPPQA